MFVQNIIQLAAFGSYSKMLQAVAEQPKRRPIVPIVLPVAVWHQQDDRGSARRS
jgi:hypothetical protein